MTNPQGITYRAAGVDIEAGDALVERIKPLAKATSRTGVMGGLGGFGALFDLKAAGFTDPVLVSTTDGVGTKLKVAIETGRHDTVGIDLVAMCVNDLVVQGAEPLFFLDYFATGALEVDQAAAVIAGIAAGCRQAGCALVGGETAEMPGMYGAGDYDLAGFSVGAAERTALLPRDVQPGDTILALPSSGVHSNGYSLVRRVMALAGAGWDDKAPFAAGQSFADVLMAPTRIYVQPMLSLHRAGLLLAAAHITGGGLPGNLPRVLPPGMAAELDASAWILPLLALHRAGLLRAAAHITGGGLPGNLPRVLPEGTSAVLDGCWSVPPVFTWLARTGGVAADEMLRVFNCGVGMALVVRDAPAAIAHLLDLGEPAVAIGHIVATDGAPEARVAVPAGWLD